MTSNCYIPLRPFYWHTDIVENASDKAIIEQKREYWTAVKWNMYKINLSVMLTPQQNANETLTNQRN